MMQNDYSVFFYDWQDVIQKPHHLKSDGACHIQEYNSLYHLHKYKYTLKLTILHIGVFMKLITIKDDQDGEEFQETIRTRRIYKMSETINVDASSTSLPDLFNDMDENSELCGVESELPMSQIVAATQQLDDLNKEYKIDVENFASRVKSHEERARNILNPLLDKARALRPDLAMEIESVNFRDQNGEAKIAARLSVALDKKKEQKQTVLTHNPVEVIEG